MVRVTALIMLCALLAGCQQQSVEPGPPERYKAGLSSDCSEELVVVFARGSSQSQDISGQPETRQFFQAVDDVVVSTKKVGFHSVRYPATGGLDTNVEAYQNKAARGAYHDSREAGTKETIRFLTERSAHCDKVEKGAEAWTRQRFVLGGYSQGAHVVRTALFELPESVVDRISYVGLFGDPTFRKSANARGTFGKDAVGVFGGAEPQFPDRFREFAESYCSKQDFLCSNGSSLGDLLLGQVRDLFKHALKIDVDHALYPFEEMFQAATRYLNNRALFGGPQSIDMKAGDFPGRYEGTVGCDYPGGDPLKNLPGHLGYLILDITSAGIRTTESETVEDLTAVLTYEDTGEPRKRLARAALAGTGTDGKVVLKHVRWLEGKNQRPRDIIAGAVSVIRNNKVTTKESAQWRSLRTPLKGHAGCTYWLG